MASQFTFQQIHRTRALLRSAIYADSVTIMGMVAFCARLLLYCGTCVLTLQVKGLESDTARSLIMSSLQILVVACCILLYMVARVLFDAAREAYSYDASLAVTDDVNSVAASDISFGTLDGLHSEIVRKVDDTDAALRRPHTSADVCDVEVSHSPPLTRENIRSCGNLDVEAMGRNIDIISRAESADKQGSVDFNIELESAKRGAVAGACTEAWHFKDTLALHTYIARVHVVGALLWSTVTALDFSHPILMTFFVTGLFIGVMLQKSAMSVSAAAKSSSGQSCASKCAHFVYCALFTVIVATCFMHETLAIQSPPDMLYYGLVAVSGFAWGVQFPAPRIVPTAQAAFISTSLMSLPLLFLLTSLDDIQMLVHTNGLSSVYMLIVEPGLKFVNVYVMILSLQASRAMEISIILLSVLSLQIGYLVYDMQDEQNRNILAVVGVAIAVLLLLHTARICLGAVN